MKRSLVTIVLGMLLGGLITAASIWAVLRFQLLNGSWQPYGLVPTPIPPPVPTRLPSVLVPMSTPTRVLTTRPTATPAPTKTPTATATPTPTDTPVPTSTPEPTPPPTATPTPTNMPTPTRTPTPAPPMVGYRDPLAREALVRLVEVDPDILYLLERPEVRMLSIVFGAIPSNIPERERFDLLIELAEDEDTDFIFEVISRYQPAIYTITIDSRHRDERIETLATILVHEITRVINEHHLARTVRDCLRRRTATMNVTLGAWYSFGLLSPQTFIEYSLTYMWYAHRDGGYEGLTSYVRHHYGQSCQDSL